MSSSIIRRNLPDNRREKLREIGEQGELNVNKLLSDHFGHRNISWGFKGYSEGTNGCPDLVIKTNPPLAVEIKSIMPYTTRKGNLRSVNYVAIKREQWINEKQFAMDKKGKLIVIVEVRLRDKGIYFWFTSKQIDKYMKELKGETIHISLWKIFRDARSLIYPDELMYLEYWNKNTASENQYQANIV